MNENRTERSGGRRRGGRRRSRDRGDRADVTSAPQQKKPATLWEKIISFFRPKAKDEARPARNYPVYEPRQKSSEGGGNYQPRENRENRDDRDNREPRAPREPRENREPRSSRKPEAVEVTSSKLYVGNLSFDATESDLMDLFNGIGVVQSAELVTHKETEKSKGFGFVTMTTIDEAKRAVSELHDKDFMGRKLVVSGAKTPAGR